ncbi:DUF6924 domain-containing protein [Streptomyces sp. NPDC059441]|uniref:DUF6924 domain-containing protein n=1 Tax=Streptomyces sp. NPDC059441 TaxID=3346829 RepID=UPI0036A53F7C
MMAMPVWSAIEVSRARSLPVGMPEMTCRNRFLRPCFSRLAAVSADEELAVFFLADGAALHAGHGALLAVSTLTREECESDEEFEAEGGEFRTAPAGIHEIHANLMIANLDFSDFADAAEAAPDGIFRSL